MMFTARIRSRSTAGVNGAPQGQVNFQLDATSHNDTYLNTSLPFPNPDAVQEFKVQTNTFDAQQGYSAGATVNVAVKSGSNDVHGSAWYFNRDRSRTANNFFGNASNQSRPIRSYHRFGGVFSGPIALPKIYNGTDRTFFLKIGYAWVL